MDSKNSRKLVRIGKIGVIIGAVITLLSFFVSLVPCTGDGLCKLPNPFTDLSVSSSKYYGVSNNPITGLLLQFLIPALILGLILIIFKKKPKRVLDLTKK